MADRCGGEADQPLPEPPRHHQLAREDEERQGKQREGLRLREHLLHDDKQRQRTVGPQRRAGGDHQRVRHRNGKNQQPEEDEGEDKAHRPFLAAERTLMSHCPQAPPRARRRGRAA